MPTHTWVTMGHSQNNFGDVGWNLLMDQLDTFESLTSFNGVDGLAQLFRGGHSTVLLDKRGLGERHIAVAVARLLRRSKGTLTRLDLR